MSSDEEVPVGWKQNQKVRCPECGCRAVVCYRDSNGNWMGLECDVGHEMTMRGFGLIPYAHSELRQAIEKAFDII